MKPNSTKLLFRRSAIISALILFSLAASLKVKAQDDDGSMVQSGYYDAIVLYYAMNDFYAYPFQMTDQEANAANEGATGEDPFNAPKKYKIIESKTGKVLLDNLKPAQVDSIFNSTTFKFPRAGARDTLIYEILARNAGVDTESANWIDKVKKIYEDNPYFRVDTKDKTQRFLFNAANFRGHLFFQDPAPFSPEGGGLTKTQIAEGVTEFLIEAVNKEVNEAFFVHLQKALAKFDELRLLFPNTLEALNKIEVTRYSSSLNVLKASFEDDIKAILSNISKLATLERYQRIINRTPVLTVVFVACDIVAQLQKETIAPEIIYQLGKAPYVASAGVSTNNYNSTIRLAALLSNSLRNIKIGDQNKNTIGWVDRKNLNELRDNEPLFRIFMGLFAQNAEKIVFRFNAGTFGMQKALYDNMDAIIKTRYIVYNFSQTVSNLNEYTSKAAELRKTDAKHSEFVKIYLKMANEIIGFSEKCLDVLPTDVTIKVRQEIKIIKDQYVPMVKQANEVVVKLEEKEYSRALYEADTLIVRIFDKGVVSDIENEIKALNNDIKKAEDGHSTADEIAQLKTRLEKLEKELKADKNFEEVREYYIKYGLFVCSVAEAKNSTDVKEAIQAVALPTGSSRIKKERKFTIGLNAYVGVYHAWNKKQSGINLPKTEWGITAPIGFAMSWGKFLGTGSFSIYGGLVDVGAIFTYKVNTDNSVKSDIEFGQLLSPSLGFTYGLPIIKKYNIPLSIGVNHQWGPKLRKVDDTGNSVLPLLTRRINVFVAVDIPIVNFHVSKN